MTTGREGDSLERLSSAPTLLARSSLADTPLPEFLVHALDNDYEGTLILQGPGGAKDAIYFERGAPAKVRAPSAVVRLPDLLVDLGLVDRGTVALAQAACEASQVPLLQHLRGAALVDDTGLYLAVREQIHRQVLSLCDLPGETGFGFYRENFLANDSGGMSWRVKPLPTIWRSLVDHLPASRVSELSAKLGQLALRMRFEAPVSRYRLSASELNVVNLLRAKAQPLPLLAESGVGTPDLVRRVVVALLLSRQLQEVNAVKPPVGSSEPPESPASIPPPSLEALTRASVTAPRVSTMPVRGSSPPSMPPESINTATFRREIEAFRDNPPATYYQILGVDETADTATIRAEFFRLAKRWHPDKLSDALEDLRPVVSQAFARMGEAHQALTDPMRRAEYDQKLHSVPDEEQAKVAEILEACSAYQRAEILLKKRDLAGARREAEKAYKGDPTQANHIALYAHLLSQESSDPSEALALLDQALKEDPRNVPALRYRAQLLKKTGKTTQAMRDFRTILEIRPQDVDAQRELRLHDMRRRTEPTTPVASDRRATSPRRPDGSLRPESADKSAGGGLLGRFFKKP